MLAVWILAAAVWVLAAVVLGALWAFTQYHSSDLDGLTDEEIAERLAPVVAAELLIMEARADRAAAGHDPEDPVS